MQTFKRLAAAAVIAVAISAAFAVDYSGDLQLELGWQGASAKVTDYSPIYIGTVYVGGAGGPPVTVDRDVDISDTEFLNNSFYMGLSNWNLFGMGKLFSVGFYDKLDMSVGNGSGKINVKGSTLPDRDINTQRFGLNFIIGPAVALRVVNIVKLQLGVGFLGGVEIARISGDGISDGKGNGVFGFAADFQAKFLPRSIVSPLVGFQYAYRNAHSFTYKTDISYPVTMGATIVSANVPNQTIDGRFNAHSYALYVGASWNFGKR